MVDHSAFDAYAFLVEAGGRRLFYSGDLRSHGRKQQTVEQLIQSPPAEVNVLMLEGTTVGRTQMSPSALSEKAVEDAARRVFVETEGLVLCFFSPQNIDRLVSLFRAAKRAGRTFVYDLYAASVARATLNPRIPQPAWPEVRVYLPHAQRTKVIESEQFARVDAVKQARIFGEELASDPKRFVMLARASMGPELARAGCLDGARAIWSQWPGYLREPSGERTKAWLSEHRIPLEIIHASVMPGSRISAASLTHSRKRGSSRSTRPIPNTSPMNSVVPNCTPTESGGRCE